MHRKREVKQYLMTKQCSKYIKALKVLKRTSVFNKLFIFYTYSCTYLGYFKCTMYRNKINTYRLFRRTFSKYLDYTNHLSGKK